MFTLIAFNSRIFSLTSSRVGVGGDLSAFGVLMGLPIWRNGTTPGDKGADWLMALRSNVLLILSLLSKWVFNISKNLAIANWCLWSSLLQHFWE